MRENAIVDEVLRRLALPRVGLLCDEAGDLPRSDAFTWVIYPRRGGEGGARVYPLPELRRPEDEGATLDVLVALDCPAAAEGRDGVPRPAEKALIRGCLKRGVPVLIHEPSGWRWHGGQGERTLVLNEPGWMTWRELCGRDLKNISSVRLGRGVRLTPEARDQLARRRIEVLEG